MTLSELLIEAYGRIGGIVHEVCDDISPEDLHHRPDPEANTIAWLIWHLTRVQDHHIAQLRGGPQVWVREGWGTRLGMDDDPQLTGYGQSPAEVGALTISEPRLLSAYYDAVAAETAAYLAGLDASALDVVIDRSYDPPVTVGVRLASVLSDDLQHAGQAAYVKGCAERR